ncbi:hypothetical protein [uncultured Jatrophihabitans sp.]|uniref:hypothetical protein n=1 Tax=uncultured Jatrophihabitans sp. TaxID=1610747 RepID=UPI0035CC13CD
MLVALLAIVPAAGCSSESTKSKMLHQMHKITPNTPDDDIVSDADVACGNSASAARKKLFDDSAAAVNGVNGLSSGPPPSAALMWYVNRLLTVVHSTHYC